MKKTYIPICKSLNEKNWIYAEKNTYEIVQASNNNWEKNWIFLGLGLYPFMKELKYHILPFSSLVSGISSFSIGILLGVGIEILQNYFTKEKKYHVLSVDKEDLKLYIDRGTKMLKAQMIFYSILIFVTIINGFYLYDRNTVFDFIFSVLFGILLFGLFVQFNMFERRDILRKLSQNIQKSNN